MLVARVTEAYVLKLIRRRIIQEMANWFSEQNCVISDAPLPVSRPDMYWSCTITPEQSNYEQNEQGPCDILEHGRIMVTPILSDQTGPTGQVNTQLVGNTGKAMIGDLKPAILKALLTETDGAGTKPWAPMTDEGHMVFAENPKVLSCIGPKQYEMWPGIYMPMVFRFSWFWDLS